MAHGRPIHPHGAKDSARRLLSLAIALALNLALLLGASLLLQTAPWKRDAPAPAHAAALQVRLIEPPRPPEPPPAAAVGTPRPSPPPAARTAPATARTESSPRRTAPAPAATEGAAPLQLFDRSGAVRLPDASAGAAPAAAAPDPLRRRPVLPYTPTRLDAYWPSVHESRGEEWVRRATSHTWQTPWGARIDCSRRPPKPPLLIIEGCTVGPPPPATGEELQRMRADPPPPRGPPRD